MAKRRPRKQNRAIEETPSPAEPVFEESMPDEPVFDAEPAAPDRPDEPFFGEPTYDDEPAPQGTLAEPMFEAADDSLPEEPFFGYAPEDNMAASSAPVAAHVSSPSTPAATTTTTPGRQRRLGRTGPFWILALGVVILVVTLVWLAVREDSPESLTQEVATPLPGLAGSTTMPLEVEIVEPTATPAPTAVPLPLFAVNQRVAVGNTDGEGIRLRNQPGLNGQTLAIYKDGDPFVVLEPDGSDVEYPVEADGYRWYRIQVDTPGETLTGWAAGNFLVAVEE